MTEHQGQWRPSRDKTLFHSVARNLCMTFEPEANSVTILSDGFTIVGAKDVSAAINDICSRNDLLVPHPVFENKTITFVVKHIKPN